MSQASTQVHAATGTPSDFRPEEKRVIFASSLGTVFEWYDFYLYATLAPFFAALFFPKGNDTAALLSSFATYAAGFLVRPFGALVFGRVGDIVGRKYTFLVTITVMGAATFRVGLLPTFERIGWAAPVLLVTLRLLQGLALGGEYGGAATYVAEHAAEHRRGYDTSWIQTTATLGFFLALIVILVCRTTSPRNSSADWGWRIPFLVSLFLLIFSIYIRLKLEESPVFKKIKSEGQDLEGTTHRKLRQLEQREDRAARAAWRHRRPGRGVVHGPVLRAILPHHHAQARLPDGIHADRRFISDRHAVFHFLRLAIGQDRSQEHHHGRLLACGADLLPVVQRADPLRQPGSRSGELQKRPYPLSATRLQLPHFRWAVVEIQRLRQGEGFSHQARDFVHIPAGGGRRGRGH